MRKEIHSYRQQHETKYINCPTKSEISTEVKDPRWMTLSSQAFTRQRVSVSAFVGLSGPLGLLSPASVAQKHPQVTPKPWAAAVSQ